MQQTGYCPRGPFCAFAHVDRKYLLMIQIYVHFVLLYNMGKSFFCMSLALLVNKISLSGPSTETIHWQCGFLNWLRKEISSIMASQLNQCPINILKVFFVNFTYCRGHSILKFSFSAEDTVSSREANGEQSFSQVCYLKRLETVSSTFLRSIF